MTPDSSGQLKFRRALLGILLLGLIMGVFYTFLVPPWQHYDEPSQFEYAWLYANYPGQPDKGFYDQRMRREVAASMLEHGFFKNLTFLPNLLSQTEPVWIGISQVGDQPLYYWLVSLPLRLVKYTEITTQLYVARLTSLLMFLIVIISSWGISKELFSNTNSALVLLVPLTITLIPGVVDMMTSVNNDVGAAAIFSLFLWGCTRLLKHKINLLNLLWAALAAAACYFTKSTVWVAIPLFAFAVLVAIFPRQYRWIPAIFITSSLVILAYAVLGRGNAAGWVIPGLNVSPTRQQISMNSEPGYALKISLDNQRPNQAIRQSFSPETRTSMKGQTMTISGRAWSSSTAQIEIGFRSGSGWQQKTTLLVKQQINKFSTKISVPENAQNVWFEISSRAEENSQQPLDIFFDELQIKPDVSNIENTDKTPSADQTLDQAGINLIFNPSGEVGWLRVRSWVYDQVGYNIYNNLSYTIYALSNLNATGWYFRETFNYLLETFWSRLGWGNVPLPGKYSYLVLWFVSLAGILGTILHLRHIFESHPRSMISLFLAVILILWTQAVLRGIGSLFGIIWIPSARYALPAVIPTVLVLCAGWHNLWQVFSRGNQNRMVAGWYFYWVFFAVLNTLTVLGLVNYHYL